MSQDGPRMYEILAHQLRNAEERHEKERAILFENEALAVKVLQAVPGAALVGALSQVTTLDRLAGRVSVLMFLTAMIVALLAAVLAAHWKHQYKLYDVKAASTQEERLKVIRVKRRDFYLTAMRVAMWVAVVLIALGFTQLLGFLWAVWWKG